MIRGVPLQIQDSFALGKKRRKYAVAVRLRVNCLANDGETLSGRMRVTRQHHQHTMSGDLGQIGVVDAGGSQVGDVAVSALVGADV